MSQSSSTLNREQANRFAQLALKCVNREFPNKLDHTINNQSEVKSPKQLHPAFYGCFDWHSSVHGHWMLVRLLKTYPDLPDAAKIRSALGANLTAENLKVETAYFGQEGRGAFERTYGWAWLLKLSEELNSWDDPEGKLWASNIRPLAETIVKKYTDFLPKQTYPIRTGVHPNTAFGLAFALDYARSTNNKAFEQLLVGRSTVYYDKDQNYPASWEPGGEDFFSPALMEADLMRRVLEPAKYKIWLRNFLPELTSTNPGKLFVPAVVTDRTDGKIVHLDGLNLSRAWCLRNIASVLSPSDPARKALAAAAEKHMNASLPNVTSGDYAGEHWLASFAVYMLSTPKP